MRRAFDVTAEDEECLGASGHAWETVADNQAKWLIITNYPVPPGYNHQQVTIALRIPPSYPDDQIDMAYFWPPLVLTNGRPIPNLTPAPVDGKEFQQWSRHRTAANPWRPGLDNVCTHLLLVNTWLLKEPQR
jgi:hypothetical protein